MSNSLFLTSRYKRYYQNMLPLFKTRKLQAYTMVILSLLCMSFFGFFAVRPTLKTIAVLQKQIEDRTLVSQQLEQKINALIQAQEEYKRVEADMPLIYSLLPEKPEFTSLLIKVEQLTEGKAAALKGVNIDPIVLYGQTAAPVTPETASTPDQDVLASQTGTITTPVSFSITYQGGYQDLVQILTQLTKLDRIVTINSAELKLNDATVDLATLVISLRSAAYYYPLEQIAL